MEISCRLNASQYFIVLDQETNYYRTYINLYFIRNKIVKHTHNYEHVPHMFSVSYICIVCVFRQRQNTSDPTNRKHNFSVNIQHLCKARFLLSFVITACEKSRENPIFLYPSLLIFISIRLSSSSAEEGQAEGFKTEQIVLKRTDCHSPIPDVSCLIKWRFTKVLPLRKMMPQRCGYLRPVTHFMYVSHLNHQRDFACVLPHITERMHGGKTTDTLWRSSK